MLGPQQQGMRFMQIDKLIKHFKQNDKGRDFVVGDIHGCFDLLTFRLGKIDFNEAIDRLFSVGDLVDRGAKSEDCVKWLNKPWFHAVRGNHEQMAIDYTLYAEKTLYQMNGGQWFIDLNGGEQKCFATLFRQLPIAIEVETKSGLIGIIHADCPVNDWNDLGNALENDKRAIECAIWNRGIASSDEPVFIKNIDKVYFGHTPTKEPKTIGNCVFIDTGAVFGGQLTVIQIQ